ncbi:MAG: hypothetical protein ACLPGW_19515 [Roseiarcus sp.]
MAAPIVGFLVAALTGAALPSAATHAVFGAVGGSILAVDSAADAAYADLPAICAATDAPLDRLSDLADKGGASGAPLRRLADSTARAADAVCAAAKAPNTPADRLRAAAAAIDAIAKANAAAPAAAAEAPAPVHGK